jgi:hypothetical protein
MSEFQRVGKSLESENRQSILTETNRRSESVESKLSEKERKQ